MSRLLTLMITVALSAAGGLVYADSETDEMQGQMDAQTEAAVRDRDSLERAQADKAK